MQTVIFVVCIGIIGAIGIYIITSEPDSPNGAVARPVPRDIVAEMRADYANALAELRQNPTSPTLHENALHLGRLYAAATRENKAVTIFDETALANDIRAATANASQQVAPVQAVTTQTTTLDERINALKKLKESGLISDEEFAQKRKEILDSI